LVKIFFLCKINTKLNKLNKIIIPNAITSLNILSGAISIYISLRFPNYLYLAGIFIFIAAVFDFFDGFVARILKAQSEFGKQFDSLSDVISFGLAPTFIMFNLISFSTEIVWLPFISFIIVLFSAIRLAIFNITNQEDSFKGLPTPALALFVASIAVCLKINFFLLDTLINIQTIKLFFSNTFFLSISTIFLSIMLVTKVELLSLKFKSFDYKKNKSKYFLLIFSVLCMVLFGMFSISIIILFYILFSIFVLSPKVKKM